MANIDFKAANLFGLEGKVAVVTGGGTGIGVMMARGLADNGATVYIGGRRRNVVDKAASEYVKRGSGSLIGFELDVTSKDSISKLVAHIESNHGKLDILINNAGQVGPVSSFMKTPSAPELASPAALGKALFNNETPEDWAALYTINVSSIYFVTVAFLPLLERGSDQDEPFSSSVVNITSISGSTKLAQAHFAYNSSKAAGDHITRMLATEFALKGAHVRVNAIAPGLFPTEMTDKEGKEFGAEETTTYSGAINRVPGGRSGRAEEIAGPALFLVSRAGRYTNGQVLTVDGSWLTVNP